MKDLGKCILVYLIGCLFLFSAIYGYINASNKMYEKKELPVTKQVIQTNLNK